MRALSSPNYQQILTKISVVIFDIVVKKMNRMSLVATGEIPLIWDVFMQKLSRHKPNLESTSKYVFPLIWGEKLVVF